MFEIPDIYTDSALAVAMIDVIRRSLLSLRDWVTKRDQDMEE